MEFKIEHCKSCDTLTPPRGNILNIKKLRVRTRGDLSRVIGSNFKVKCHSCKAEEIYDDKDVVAIDRKVYHIYGAIWGLFVGFLALIWTGIYHTKIEKIIVNGIYMTDTELLLVGSLTGFIIGLTIDIIDKRRAKKFNGS